MGPEGENHWSDPTITLPDLPRRILRLQLLRSLCTQGRCAGKYCLDRTEIEFVQRRFVLGHKNNDWRYLQQRTHVSAVVVLALPILETNCTIVCRGAEETVD